MTRLEKFQSLAQHSFYRRDLERLPEATFDWLVEFLEDTADLDNDAYTIKVTRLWASGGRPKNHGTLCDILLASRV